MTMTYGSAKPRGHRRRGGFSLLEATVVTTIVGVGALAVIELLAAGTMNNAASTEKTTAINLAGNVREIAVNLAFADPEDPDHWSTGEAGVGSFDDIKDLDGKTFSPPLDGRRQPIPEYGGWSQVITVDTVAEDYLISTRPKDPEAPAARVTVNILRNGRQVYTNNWVAVAKNPAWP
jgi:type II secretory pathway pseudopilin PulG